MGKFSFGIMMLLCFGFFEIQGQNSGGQLVLPTDPQSLAGKPLDPKKLLTLILANEERVIYYTGFFKKNIAIKKIGYDEVRDILAKKRKSIGDSLVVFVKLADGIQYKNVTDILDEMAINDIKIYALMGLEKEEADRFGLKVFGPQPGEMVFSPPTHLENPSYENKEVLLIEFNNNGEIAYGLGIGTKQPLTKLPASDSAQFGGIIKKLIEGKSKFEVLVKGGRDAKYPTFELVMEALKQNELLRFKMITEIE